jgi:hypothetical protein
MMGVPFSRVFPARSGARGVAVPHTDAQADGVRAHARFDL